MSENENTPAGQEKADQWAREGSLSPAQEPSDQPPSPQTQDPDMKKPEQQRTFAMLCHLLALASYIVPVPVANILGPLIVWLLKKDEMPFVDDQGKESLNFQITMTLAALLCIPFVFVCGIGVIMAIVVAIADIVFVIIASVKAYHGEAYRYPVSIRFIR